MKGSTEMSKFSGSTSVRYVPNGPVTVVGDTVTFEGGAGFTRDHKSELFMFAVANMVGEDTYYESASDRDDRFRTLVRTVTVEDADWVARFVPFLRREMGMRSAAVVMAAESAQTRLVAGVKGDAQVRDLVSSALQRPDEPAEFVGYWMSRGYGKLSGGVKRGVADAVQRLFTERAALKYDGSSRSVRMGDVIELTHPKPVAGWQGDVFKWLLDQRHHNDGKSTALTPMIAARETLDRIPVDERRAFLLAHSGDGDSTFESAGMTWEALSGWLQGPMDAAAWEAVIPSMGLMALTRNLRNFDEAGVSDQVAARIGERFTDADEVARSRQFPFRFYQAAKAAPSPRWVWPLDQAASLATRNIPVLSGRTLVLLDTSGSMQSVISGRSRMTCVESGAVFAGALAARNPGSVRLVNFADGVEEIYVHPGLGVLRTANELVARVGRVGHGTRIADSVRAAYRGEDRVIILTDMQSMTPVPRGGLWGGNAVGDVASAAPANVPMYGVNVAGYAATALDTRKDRRFELGGMSDRMFSLIPLLESAQSDVDWPF